MVDTATILLLSPTTSWKYLWSPGLKVETFRDFSFIMPRSTQRGWRLAKTSTPWKINMEPTNHPFRKENDLPNLHDHVPAVNLPGCTQLSVKCGHTPQLIPETIQVAGGIPAKLTSKDSGMSSPWDGWCWDGSAQGGTICDEMCVSKGLPGTTRKCVDDNWTELVMVQNSERCQPRHGHVLPQLPSKYTKMY